jgi:hypothetical protein
LPGTRPHKLAGVLSTPRLENAQSQPLDFIKPPKVSEALRDIRERYYQINVRVIRSLVTRR